ncbi:MAG TPA: hypothetical protein HA254_07795 [Candidatus Diapherotrites archaeon]|uniref:DOD-type homing endonuclease domain-containing protein n=1 Tax=Candidatus Iainarchaeum sp. TaxID=3101447 RepID=A0A7J4IYQ7_9ARCH|nr:hypothetical protein [Candidatus Diapherotrites archaeon]
MKRLSESELVLVEDLIWKNVSLAQISKVTGRQKSTLYHHYKRIRGKRFHEPEFEVNCPEVEGEIAGVFAGDGSQYYNRCNWHYEVNVHFGRLDYAYYVKELFEGYFHKEFRLGKQSPTVYRLRTQSRKIFAYFHTYLDYDPAVKHSTVKLKDMKLSRGFKIGFLRGLVDTDGTVCRCKDKRIRIAFFTTSKALAQQTKLLLEEFGFEAFVSVREKDGLKDCFSTYLFNGSVKPFLRLIMPFRERKLRALSVEA